VGALGGVVAVSIPLLIIVDVVAEAMIYEDGSLSLLLIDVEVVTNILTVF
jgi:hypothetical protein